jgi:hypothetical protein
MRLWHTLFFLWAAVCNAGAQQSLKVQLLGNWNDSAHVRINLNGQRYNDVYGLVVKGKEYAAIGSTEGVHIIDIDAMKQVATRSFTAITRPTNTTCLPYATKASAAYRYLI